MMSAEGTVVRALIFATAASLIGLGVLVTLGFTTARPSPVLFLVLLSIELLVLQCSLSNAPGARRVGPVLVFVIPLALALAARTWQASSPAERLEWDASYK